MSRIEGWITSATDLARSAMDRGMSMVGVPRSEPKADPKDHGKVQLGRIMSEMVGTQGWSAFEAILSARRERAWRDLSSCKQDELQHLQSEAKVLDEILQQPYKWIGEGEEAEARLNGAQNKESGNGG